MARMMFRKAVSDWLMRSHLMKLFDALGQAPIVVDTTASY